MSTQDENKPATQTVGVVGAATDEYGIDSKPTGICWPTLVQVPKFQMFASELSRMSSGSVMEWITEFVFNQVKEKGEQAFFDEYAQWHDRKGYWNNETVYGELIE
ncbi:hypothetical protein [Acinetobacter entericus]|uniref:Uncharacterized protein n=1 Tax=Acinetobacter entericus TaxID=2989714 RepID=A0ABT3NEF5_9GAMM|nr:hypothetical protein [Acinetobacter entericus]MCW8037947.1 hypothetical protein [Acinetobacter entericus]